ncbi:MAG TPA: hypothetical protein VFB22_10305 [Candidatus Baltobacteraceae bacterium]|nr:hypothetical protein [Candidatus Baltobacteraceae bacterium]
MPDRASAAGSPLDASWKRRREAALVARGIAAASIAGIVMHVSALAGAAVLATYFVADAACSVAFARAGYVRGASRFVAAASASADLAVAYLVVRHAHAGALPLVAVSLWALATGLLETGAAAALPAVPAAAWAVALAGTGACAIGMLSLDWTNLAILGFFSVILAYGIAGTLVIAAGVYGVARIVRRASLSARPRRATSATPPRTA